MFIFIRKNGYYASQKRLCKQPVLRGGIFIAFSKRQFEVEKSPKIQLYQYVREWLDTGKKFSGLIKKSACLLLPLNIEETFMNTQLPAILFTQQINQNLQTAPVYGGAVSLSEVSSDENFETAPTENEEPSCSPAGGTQAELPSGVDNKEIDFDEEIDFDSDKSLYNRNIGE